MDRRVEKLVRLFSGTCFRGLAVQAEVRQSLEIHARSRNQVQDFSVLFEHSKNNVSQILQEVKTIRNLHGIRNCPPRRFRVEFAATIPAHHLYSWMLRKPVVGESVRAALGQNVY